MIYLTSMRGIASIAIMFFHIKHLMGRQIPVLAWVIDNGYLAVDFFSILSGFILSYNYHSHFRSLHASEYYHFIAKRIARIYPMHLAVLLAFTVIPLMLLLTNRSIDVKQFGVYALVTKLLLVDAWGLGNEFAWNAPSWFISAQFAAFLAFPFLIYTISRMRTTTLPLLLVALAAILAWIFYFSGLQSIGGKIDPYGLIRCNLEFSMGIVIFFIKQKNNLYAGQLPRVIGYGAFGAFILFAAFGINNYFYTPLLFALIILSLTGYRGGVHRMLETRPLIYLGNISYSIYMTHCFTRDLMSMIFLENNQGASWMWIISYILVTLVLSSMAYKWIEVPGRKYLMSSLIRPEKIST
jgi:peptidoglycan/LPS O-acetylase OafA/YrhL